MNILIIRKDALAQLPPLLSAACIISDLGHHVHIISSEFSPSIIKVLDEKGITYEVLNHSGSTTVFGKVKQYLTYRYEAKKILSSRRFDLLWVEGGHTVLALGNVLKRYKYILQISELYDRFPKIMRAIKNVINGASVVFMPEYNRSVLYQIWFGLKRRPVVLPNKPYFIPTSDELSYISRRYKHYINQIEGKKIILYQGLIHSQRKLDNFIAAAREMGDDWVFVIMGKDDGGLISKYREINPNIIHIDFIPAPDYLCITQKAYVGILSYDPMLHNTAYCAPNKIYEYGAFSIPMIGNDIPGLKVLESRKAGVVVNDAEIDSIINAYKRINLSHDEYSINSSLLFKSTDNKQIIREALSSI